MLQKVDEEENRLACLQSIVHRLLCIAILLLTVAVAAPADTIYQTNAQGKRVVIQRDAILVKQDSSFLIYKHFDLQQRRVAKVTLNQGSLPYSIETESASRRQQIVSVWKRFGYTVTVSGADGKTTRVFDAYLDFYPPEGRGSLLESLPATTSLPLQLSSGGVDVIEFLKISRIELSGDQFKVTLQNGQVETGKFLMPTTQPAEARFLGLTDHYDPASPDVFDFSLALAKIKQIEFE
jgi:hypothetical protein